MLSKQVVWTNVRHLNIQDKLVYKRITMVIYEKYNTGSNALFIADALTYLNDLKITENVPS